MSLRGSGSQIAGITVSKTPERRFPFHRTGGTPPPEYSSALNLMGLAALNLHKGIASLCTPARQKSEVCDLAQGSLTSSFIGFYKNSRRTSCKRNSRCSRQAAWITGYVMGKTKPTNISADRLCLAYYSIFSRTQTGILCGIFSALKHGFLQLFRNNQRDASFRLRPDKDIGFILYAF